MTTLYVLNATQEAIYNYKTLHVYALSVISYSIMNAISAKQPFRIVSLVFPEYSACSVTKVLSFPVTINSAVVLRIMI
jgi:hypothetical protein